MNILMLKSLQRIVTALLVPCLLVDPVLTAATRMTPDPLPVAPLLFSSQALAAEGVHYPAISDPRPHIEASEEEGNAVKGWVQVINRPPIYGARPTTASLTLQADPADNLRKIFHVVVVHVDEADYLQSVRDAIDHLMMHPAIGIWELHLPFGGPIYGRLREQEALAPEAEEMLIDLARKTAGSAEKDANSIGAGHRWTVHNKITGAEVHLNFLSGQREPSAEPQADLFPEGHPLHRWTILIETVMLATIVALFVLGNPAPSPQALTPTFWIRMVGLLASVLFSFLWHRNEYGKPLAMAGITAMFRMVIGWILPASWRQAIRRMIPLATLAILFAGALAVQGWSAPPGQTAAPSADADTHAPAAAVSASDPTREEVLRTITEFKTSPLPAKIEAARRDLDKRLQALIDHKEVFLSAGADTDLRKEKEAKLAALRARLYILHRANAPIALPEDLRQAYQTLDELVEQARALLAKTQALLDPPVVDAKHPGPLTGPEMVRVGNLFARIKVTWDKALSQAMPVLKPGDAMAPVWAGEPYPSVEMRFAVDPDGTIHIGQLNTRLSAAGPFGMTLRRVFWHWVLDHGELREVRKLSADVKYRLVAHGVGIGYELPDDIKQLTDPDFPGPAPAQTEPPAASRPASSKSSRASPLLHHAA